MGYSTELFCNISFNRETFNERGEVLDKIHEFELYLQIAKDHLRNLVMMTEPQKYCPEDYDTIIWVNNEFRDRMEEIEEYTIELYKLRTLLDNWDYCHNKDGLAIDFPENVSWDKAFLEGDFVRTVNHPNLYE